MKITALGGYQTNFARNWTREGLDVSNLVREVIEQTLDRAASVLRGAGLGHAGAVAGPRPVRVPENAPLHPDRAGCPRYG